MFAPQPWPDMGTQNAVPPQPFQWDIAMLGKARQLWAEYAANHRELQRKPLGIAIHPKTHRGHLLFRQKPILLMNECFIPFSEIAPEPNPVSPSP